MTPDANEVRLAMEALLEKEKSKVICEVCNGRGSTRLNVPFKHRYTHCTKCNGEGRYLPDNTQV